MITVSFVGAGNTATALAKSLHAAGCRIHEICARDFNHALSLATEVDAVAVQDTAHLSPGADAVILAVPDSAIATLQLPRHNWIVIHTAGSVPMDSLKPIAQQYGVMWPICSIRKDQPCDFHDVPVCVEGNSPKVITLLRQIVGSIGARPEELSSEQRMRMHLAAVIVNNFGNAMHAMTQDWLADVFFDKAGKSAPMEFLEPIARQTSYMRGNLWHRQTGPAARHDESTIKSHLKLLTDAPDLQELYKLMSDIIIRNTGD